MFKIKKIYKRSLNFAFGVLIETRCIGQIPGPQLAGNINLALWLTLS
jgi:hypothetical protein